MGDEAEHLNLNQNQKDGTSKEPVLLLIKNSSAKITDGRDEMNFAEFPLSSISERVNPGVKTLVFQDSILDQARNERITRKLTITGSDAYGLPTPMDEVVLLGLIQLSKLQRFESKRVYFTRHQLLLLLKWAPTGRNYERLELALNRWMGVTMYYQNSWRVKAAANWGNESFHILERVKVPNNRVGEKSDLCFFEWNDVVFKSFCDGNVKSLNYELFLSLDSAIAKRLYRFLDKRFFHSKTREFELKNLAFEHIGLSRNMPVAELKRKLNRAIDELEEKGFLEVTPEKERFKKVSTGNWTVSFTKRTSSANHEVLPANNDDSLLSRLVAFGVSEQRAMELIRDFDGKTIDEKLATASWMRERQDPRLAKNPPGYLIRSIEQAFAQPKEMLEEKEVKARVEKDKKVIASREAAKDKKQKAEAEREAREEEAVRSFWDAMPVGERTELEQRILSEASPTNALLIARGGKVAEAVKKNLLRSFAIEVLAGGF